MSRPTRGQDTRCSQARSISEVPPQEESRTVASNKMEKTGSSPLLPGESSLLDRPDLEGVQIPPDGWEAYRRFGEAFDQEDDVDDYALLHPNLPPVEGDTMDIRLLSPNAPGISPGPSRQIRFVSPIVLHSLVGTPVEALVTKKHRKKDTLPAKLNLKGKVREPHSEDNSMAAQRTMLQYWAANPTMAPANVPVLSDPDPVLPNPVLPKSNVLPQPAKVNIEAFIHDMAM
jgi:hypothetical protein